MTISAREFDLIVFGATGFTGQYVAEEIARIADDENVSWAVAGRNTEKMKTVLKNVEKATGDENLYNFDSLFNLPLCIIFIHLCREKHQ